MDNFSENCYDDDISLDVLMSLLELNCQTLRTNFAGTSKPSSPYEGQMYGDMNTDVLRFLHLGYGTSTFDSSEEQWPGLFHADVNDRIYVYSNSTIDGWIVDDSSDITDGDLLLAVADAGADTYDTAESVQGDGWTGISHNHQWHVDNQASSGNEVFNSSGTAADIASSNQYVWRETNWIPLANSGNWNYKLVFPFSAYTTMNSLSSNWRPRAAVGTIQYLDLS